MNQTTKPIAVSDAAKELIKDLQSGRRRGRPTNDQKSGREPDYRIVAFEEGTPTKVGVLWLNKNSGKKPVVELDLELLPETTGRLRAWLFPWNQPEDSGSL